LSEYDNRDEKTPLQGERKVPAEVFLCLLCHVLVEIREIFGYNL
jgi:hypothetical protein